jgi:hypothetical protein
MAQERKREGRRVGCPESVPTRHPSLEARMGFLMRVDGGLLLEGGSRRVDACTSVALGAGSVITPPGVKAG